MNQFGKKSSITLLIILLALMSSHGIHAQSSDSAKMMPVIVDLLLGESRCVGELSELQATLPSEELSIECDFNLDGRSLHLPSNVTLKDGGGHIFNGSLIFNGGEIDGRLLNVNLNVQGSASLISPTFNFTPSQWRIVQGRVNTETGLQNRLNLQKAINQSHRLSASRFNIERLDAYFTVGGWGTARMHATEFSIGLPSNFHFSMSDSTHLRVQPTFYPFNRLLSVFEQENVFISGGNLHGDRWEHDYSPINDPFGRQRNTHEWPGLVIVQGSRDITVDGVTMADSTGDAFIAGAAGHRVFVEDQATLNSNQRFNQRVTIKNSTLLRSRRNNISITDGEDITVENCHIEEAGLGERGNTIISAAGINPRVGIDVEPFIGYMQDGTARKIFWEKVERVTIKGNTFVNNEVASIVDYSGIDVTIANNISDHAFVASFSTGTRFLDNTLTLDPINQRAASQTGITMGYLPLVSDAGRFQASTDNVVSGNTITGFNRGISVRGKDAQVIGNTIVDFGLNHGIQFFRQESAVDPRYSRNNQPDLAPGEQEVPAFENVLIEDNVLRSNAHVAVVGITVWDTVGKNVTFNNNSITVPRIPLSFNNLDSLDSTIEVKNSSFRSLQGYTTRIRDSQRLKFTNNDFINTSLEIENSIVEYE